MDLANYFETTEGTGILATYGAIHGVNQAIYSKPFVVDNKTVAFVMCHRATHHNLQNNLSASYIFLERDNDHNGLRLTLTAQHEEKSRTLIENLRKKQPCIYSEDDDSEKFLVFFEIKQIRPLIGEMNGVLPTQQAFANPV